MNLLSRLEKIDAALHRFWARWSRWMCRGLILLIIIWGLNLAWDVFFGPPTGGVALIIHSEIDRPILGFSVNGVAGGNAFAHGGGALTCCGTIEGDTAEVIWTLSTTRTQYDAGLRKETRHKTLPLPERKWGEDNLHVHFLPNNQVKLGWSSDAWSPFEKRPENRNKKGNNTK
ncbi:DUF3304 domain-containing protein [Buttiauxella agrestis]|uniref:DUF3304 domain-containing protein n=1 Tax=Buttiauxella agrestis ATCC 33320 TaxID=1006004 RepID=A0A085G1W9_9ENTR|nr:DUF3304 domain-containing protein [Buttiauxella agrestis]KFC77714.1 hypothetical protein GBAG_3687 [Buttiauxella agrestis ATCC 33320]